MNGRTTQTTRAQVLRDYAKAQKHLDQVESAWVRSCPDDVPAILIVTPREVAAARAKVAALEQRVRGTAAQLALFA